MERKSEQQSPQKIKGFLLHMPAGHGAKFYDRLVFRQYGEEKDGRKTYKDYEIYHYDLEIVIHGDFKIVITPEGNFIDYSIASYDNYTEEKHPKELRGLLLLLLGNEITFLYYDENDLPVYCDIRHCDLQIEIVDDYYKLVEGEEFNRIDHLRN